MSNADTNGDLLGKDGLSVLTFTPVTTAYLAWFTPEIQFQAKESSFEIQWDRNCTKFVYRNKNATSVKSLPSFHPSG